ncbi:MAG: glycosyltransferase family 4 protein, partial [Planctomycetales bacterium]
CLAPVAHHRCSPRPPDPASPRCRKRVGPRRKSLPRKRQCHSGLAPLLEAFHAVRQERPAALLVIGEVRPRDQALLASFAAEHPEDRTRLIVTGHLNDSQEVARHLCLCDHFLQPSLWDGLPNAVLEAMACERIVIASDAGGLPEVIDHGVNGFLVPRTQLPRLGEAILELLALDEARRGTIGHAARKRIQEAFSAEREAAQLQQALAHLWPASGTS